MADAYIQLGYGSWLAPDDAFPKAAAAARKALELDSTLAEPHATLGFVNMYYAWDWRPRKGSSGSAIARNPSYATAHEWYGLFLAPWAGPDEAVAEERRAKALDPLSTPIAGTTGWVLHYAAGKTMPSGCSVPPSEWTRLRARPPLPWPGAPGHRDSSTAPSAKFESGLDPCDSGCPRSRGSGTYSDSRAGESRL